MCFDLSLVAAALEVGSIPDFGFNGQLRHHSS